ncbi:MAG: helix-turn-helix domain protein [Clostridiales bacterium]|jgi:transcriptional regulator with XRE-family HTH domain|nr:helix-turn-helix domain protein [Clostridiales bacterium]
MKEFQERLKFLRLEKNLTQKQLGDKLNKPRGTIATWESGNGTPDISTIVDIADFFGVSLDYLLARSNTFNQQQIERIAIAVSTIIQEDSGLADFFEKLCYRNEVREVSKLIKDLSEDSITRLIRVIIAIEGILIDVPPRRNQK